jgi:ribosomal protein S18 acetylase RimI-like enzyme
MIREVKREDLSACADLIRKSFQTVADEFGFTRENAPRFTAFATTEERLRWHMDGEHRLMYLYESNGRPCGYYSLLLRDHGTCELGSLSVLPEYRHRGIGGKLLQHAIKSAVAQGCTVMNLSIVEENTVLRRWYERHGAIHTGTEKFDFFPFTCGYMKIMLPEAGKPDLKEKLPVFPDYRHCLVNLSNSVLKKFGAETAAETLPLADQFLREEYQNTVIDSADRH